MMCDIPHNQNQFLEYKRVYNIGQLVSTRWSGVESHLFQPAVYRLNERIQVYIKGLRFKKFGDSIK